MRKILALTAMLAALMLAASACSSDPTQSAVQTDGSESLPTAVEPTAAADEPVPTPLPTVTSESEPTAEALEEPSATPLAQADCTSVPTFWAADTVSPACADRWAVSPELFASDAGWRLFADRNGQWVEVDYAKTCCDDNDVQFVELLRRNGIEEAARDRLCIDSGLAEDPSSGCDGSGRGDASAFEPTWLRVNGLGAHDFGASFGDVLATVEAVFGDPEINEVTECGAGPMTAASFDDFSLNFQDDVFIGWFYTSSVPDLTTPSGVAPGLTEAELVAAYAGVEISTESLGREFFFTVPAGAIGGFFDAESNTVSSLYAGINCFFR